MVDIKRAARTVALAAAILVAPSFAYADLIEAELNEVIAGELAETDDLATDSFGSFYYDVYEFVSLGTNPITITLDSPNFSPYLSWGFDFLIPPWPTGSNDPYDLIQDFANLNDIGSVSLTFVNPSAGQTFQVLVSTWAYLDEGARFGSYRLTTATNVSQVPEPGSLALLGIGLVGLAIARRRQRVA